MKLPINDYLYSRGWDKIGEEILPAGHIKILWKSRRTGEVYGQRKAREIQWKRDMDQKGKRVE